MIPSKRVRLLISLRKWYADQLETADLVKTLKLSVPVGRLDRRIKKAMKTKYKRPALTQAAINFEGKTVPYLNIVNGCYVHSGTTNTRKNRRKARKKQIKKHKRKNK
jgi:hypothetical protein